MYSFVEAMALARTGVVLRHPAAPRKRLFVNAFGMLVYDEPNAGYHAPFRPGDHPDLETGWERI